MDISSLRNIDDQELKPAPTGCHSAGEDASDKPPC